MKIVNIKNVVIFLAALIVFHLGVGYLLSPAVGSMAIEALNKNAGAKITLETVNVWPLTLSVTMKELKVFDPENEKERMIYIRKAGAGVSVMGLLSKKLVLSGLTLDGADIDLKGTDDGGFNIEKAAASAGTQGKKSDAGAIDWEGLKGKKDIVTKVLKMIKKKKAKKEQEAASRKTEVTVKDLPRGREVVFRTPKDRYVLEIRKVSLNDAHVRVEGSGGEWIEISGAKARFDRVAFDPENGMAFGSFEIKGKIKKGETDCGEIAAGYSVKESGGATRVNVELKRADLSAMEFIFKDSLPVGFDAGKIDARSDTKISGDKLESRNELKITGQKAVARSGGTAFGIVPMAELCNAVNSVDPLELKFNIGGSPDKPEFKDFQESLMKVVQPYLSGMLKNVQQQGVDSIMKMINKKLGK